MLSDPGLKDLETLYNSNPNEKTLDLMYKEFKLVTQVLFMSHCKKKGLYYSKDTRDQHIHDATTSLIEMYIRKYPYTCPIRTRLYKEILFILHRPTNVRKERRTCSLEQYIEITNREPHIEVEETATNIAEYPTVVAQHTQGKRIVIDLYAATYYKKAILKIATYVDKKWIYAHAVELKTIFDLTRDNRDDYKAKIT